MSATIKIEVQKRRVKKVMNFLSKMIIVFLLTFSIVGLASCTTDDTPTLILGEGDWDSHAFHNQVAGYILEHGYDVQFETVLTDTAIMITSLKANNIDISLELWSDNVPTYQEGIDAGDYEELATNYDDNTQGLYVPYYLQDDWEDFDLTGPILSVDDLKRADVIALFDDPNDPGKGVIYGGPEGWSATAFLNDKMEVQSYGLSDNYNFRTIDSGATLAAQIAGAFTKNDPIVSYYWEPTWLMGIYDLRLLDDSPYSPEDFAMGIGAFPTVNVTVVVRGGFREEYPEITAFLENYETSSALTNAGLGYMQDNDASSLEAAIWFLQENDAWLQSIVPEDVYAKVKAALDAE
jgi:glycine betaine/proline transport system substrate-binding protein